MGRTLTKKGNKKQTKAFNPKRDFLNQAVQDYLRKGGKITKIVDDGSGYEHIERIPEEQLPSSVMISC